MSEEKTDKAFWNDSYWTADEHKKKTHIPTVPKTNPIRQWIEKYLPDNLTGKTCIEVGCYPGRFLTIFGDHGATLSGVDFVDDIVSVPENLAKQGYKVGRFWNEDFFKMSINQQFDIVTSFGFIEHFTDVKKSLEAHANLVAPGGLVIIEVPNFLGGFQKFIHKNFDKENFAKHHLPAMEAETLKRIFTEMGFEIIYSGYFGQFHYWVEPAKRGFFSKLFLAFMGQLKKILWRILPADKKLYSPYCGIIAKRVKSI